jgi:hypothetical protein
VETVNHDVIVGVLGKRPFASDHYTSFLENQDSVNKLAEVAEAEVVDGSKKDESKKDDSKDEEESRDDEDKDDSTSK